MENFPGNSHNVTGEPKDPKDPKDEKPKKEEVKKVVSVDVVQRKKPLGRRFKDLFFGGEFKGATKYIFGDVLLPALRNMVVDATTKGVERVIYGESSPRRRPELGRPRISYNSPVDRGYSRSRAMLPDQPPYVSRRRQDVGEIIIVSREEAEMVVERMIDIIDKYDVASIADLHDLVGLPTTYVDNKWGWANLNNVNIRQIREGYLIDLPSAEPLGN